MLNFYLMIDGTYYKLADQQASTKARSILRSEKPAAAEMADGRPMTINPGAVAYWSIFNSSEDLQRNGEPVSASSSTN